MNRATKRFAATLATLGTLVFLCAAAAPRAKTAPGTHEPAPATHAEEELPGGQLRVFVAQPFQSALLFLSSSYEGLHRSVTVVTGVDGSGQLRGQIEAGADADVFIASDSLGPGALVRGGLADPPVRVIGRSTLALIVHPSGAVSSLADLAKPGVKIAVCSIEDPTGRATERALQRLARATGFGRAFVTKVRANIRSHEPTEYAAIFKVGRGEADATFGAASDRIFSRKNLAVVALPEGVSEPVLFAAVHVKRGRNPDTAANFVRFLLGDEAQQVLSHNGFQTETGKVAAPHLK